MSQLQRKITDFQPSGEAIVVSRVLVSLHKAIDAEFPNSKARERQYTKTVTVFGGSGEKTGLLIEKASLPPPPIPVVEAESLAEKLPRKKTKKKFRWADYLVIGLAIGLVLSAVAFFAVEYLDNILYVHP